MRDRHEKLDGNSREVLRLPSDRIEGKWIILVLCVCVIFAAVLHLAIKRLIASYSTDAPAPLHLTAPDVVPPSLNHPKLPIDDFDAHRERSRRLLRSLGWSIDRAGHLNPPSLGEIGKQAEVAR